MTQMWVGVARETKGQKVGRTEKGRKASQSQKKMNSGEEKGPPVWKKFRAERWKLSATTVMGRGGEMCID